MTKSLVFLGGGTGTPKLVNGFRAFIKDENITVIANTADDIQLNGLYISPDVDTFLYLFADILNTGKYWGIENDSLITYNFLSKLDEDNWFMLGDKDLAIHLFRTKKLQEKMKLTQITQLISNKLNIKANILPASDNHIETRIITKDNKDIHFQEFWVKHHGDIEIKNVYIKGIEKVKVSRSVKKALWKADLIILGPSNPVTSIGPILEIHEIKKILREKKEKCIAISPIIGKGAISGPTCKLLKTRGKSCTLESVISLYKDLINLFIIDNSDKIKKLELEKQFKIKIHADNIIFREKKDVKELATNILNNLYRNK